MEKQNELKVEPERVEKFIELADMVEKLQDELVLPHNFFKTIAQKIREIIPPLYESWKEYERKIAEQKAEIERLTEANEQLYCNCLNENTARLGDMRKIECLEDKNAELQTKVDELKKQIKNLTSSCQSKNEKIKNLNAEKEALQNELNFQNGKSHYRYVIWNTKQNKRQFPSICELTESGAYTKLFQKIGWDSAKYRFEARRIKIDGVDVE